MGGTMKSLSKLLAVAGAAIGATAMMLTAALPASASTQGAGRHVNYEVIAGFLAGRGALANAPVVPLQLRGAVNTSGSINLGGNSSVSPIWTRKGTLTVEHGNPNPAPQLNYRTCRETSTISTWYKVIGRQSTGVFWGAAAAAMWWWCSPPSRPGTPPARTRASATSARTRSPSRTVPTSRSARRGRCTSSTTSRATRLTSAPPPPGDEISGPRARAGRGPLRP